ncbi:hypothetical protein LCGC14_3108900, partial [marine sediment metagenome]
MAIEASLVAPAVLALMADRAEWSGTPTDLLKELTRVAGRLGIDTGDKRWPKAATWLRPRLQEVYQNLLSLGVDFVDGGRTGERRTIIIRRLDEKAVTSVTVVKGAKAIAR